MNKLAELWDELRQVMQGRGNWLDSLLPPLVFILFYNWLGLQLAAALSLGLAVLVGFWRLGRRRPVRYALAGLMGVGVAVGLALWLGRAEAFFLPSIANNGLLVLACIMSVLVRRPLVAWTSFLARRWPLSWYWHPQVRPAYAEVTWFWATFFLLRLGIQTLLFRLEAATWLGVANFITGWPAMVILLVASYLYGVWRLRKLKGPSVQEYLEEVQPPWQGQSKGF